jgi:hypothetical protein
VAVVGLQGLESGYQEVQKGESLHVEKEGQGPEPNL